MTHSPPAQLDQKILGDIKKRMSPSHKRILIKLFFVHLFVGALTLLFCPQFEFSLTGQHELFHFFHRTFGYYGCIAICGALFIGSGALFASTILTWDELNAVRKSFFLHLMALTAIFLGFFVVLDAQVYLSIAIVWSLGAYVGGSLIFQTSQTLRHLIAKSGWKSF